MDEADWDETPEDVYGGGGLVQAVQAARFTLRGADLPSEWSEIQAR